MALTDRLTTQTGGVYLLVELEWVMAYGRRFSSVGISFQGLIKWLNSMRPPPVRPISPDSYFGSRSLLGQLRSISSIPVTFHNPSTFEVGRENGSAAHWLECATPPNLGMEGVGIATGPGIYFSDNPIQPPRRQLQMLLRVFCQMAVEFARSPFGDRVDLIVGFRLGHPLPIHFTFGSVPFQNLDGVWVVLHQWHVNFTLAAAPAIVVTSPPLFLGLSDPLLELVQRINLETRSGPFRLVKAEDLARLKTPTPRVVPCRTYCLVAWLEARSPLMWDGDGYLFIVRVVPMGCSKTSSMDAFHPGFRVGGVFGFQRLRRKHSTFWFDNDGSIDLIQAPGSSSLQGGFGAHLDVCISEVLDPVLGLYRTEEAALLCLGLDPIYMAFGQLFPGTRLRIHHFHHQPSPSCLTDGACAGVLFPCAHSSWAILDLELATNLHDLAPASYELPSSVRKLASIQGILLLFHLFGLAKLRCSSRNHPSLFRALRVLVFEHLCEGIPHRPIREFLGHPEACLRGGTAAVFQDPTLECFDSLTWLPKETKRVAHLPLLGWLEVADGTLVFHLCSRLPMSLPCLVVTSDGLPTGVVSPSLVPSLWFVPHYFITHDNHSFQSARYLLYLPLGASKCLMAPTPSQLYAFIPKSPFYTRSPFILGLSMPLDECFNPMDASFASSSLITPEAGGVPPVALGIPVLLWANRTCSNQLSLASSDLLASVVEEGGESVFRLLDYPDALTSLSPLSFQTVHQVLNSVPHPGHFYRKPYPSCHFECYGIIRRCNILEEDNAWFLGPTWGSSPPTKLLVVLQDTASLCSLDVYIAHHSPQLQYVFPGQLVSLSHMVVCFSRSGKVYGHVGKTSRLSIGLPPNAKVAEIPRYTTQSVFPLPAYQELTPYDLMSLPFKYLFDFHSLPPSKAHSPPRGLFRVTAKLVRVVSLTVQYNLTLDSPARTEPYKVCGFMVAYISDGSSRPTRTLIDDIPTIFDLLQPGVPRGAIISQLEELLDKLKPEPFYYRSDFSDSIWPLDDSELGYFSSKLLCALNRINSKVTVSSGLWDLAVEPRYPIRSSSHRFDVGADASDGVESCFGTLPVSSTNPNLHRDIPTSFDLVPELKAVYVNAHHPTFDE
ncbi:hypothetical protein L0F63_000304 [Massospora cicadina]|nr:hypothetical protein L0F63_000304 [Massospora cicadina]